MRKRSGHTEFACFVRNYTERPIRLGVAFGQMEARPRMGEVELEQLLERNRSRFCATGEDPLVPQSGSGFAVGEQEIL
jgi:hypothetical protein